jgi:cytoskeletal protein CcmA (bactofilin family)
VFGKKEMISTDKIETIIGKDTVINGSVSGAGIIRVDGRIKGDEVSHGEVIVGESGEVMADIAARQVTVAGLVKGDISAEGKVEIVETGKVVGNIRSVNLIIYEGALFQGTCDMKYSAPESEEIQS